MQTPISLNTLNLGISAEALLAELEENFPHFHATPDTTMSTIMYRSGQRSVVEYVRARLEEEK